jgi:HPt (histidine-containing phosphotransfer) domain-containing protein
MTGLRVVADAEVPLHRLADRLREVGHWTPPAALEDSIDAAVEASPPALLVGVRAHLRELGSEDGPDERVLFAGLLEHFATRSPAGLARIEAAVDDGDPAGAVVPARRLARQAGALGAVPLARLCSVVAERAAGGQPGVPSATRAALRRELAVTCRVLVALAAELLQDAAGAPVARAEAPPDDSERAR